MLLRTKKDVTYSDTIVESIPDYFIFDLFPAFQGFVNDNL